MSQLLARIIAFVVGCVLFVAAISVLGITMLIGVVGFVLLLCALLPATFSALFFTNIMLWRAKREQARERKNMDAIRTLIHNRNDIFVNVRELHYPSLNEADIKLRAAGFKPHPVDRHCYERMTNGMLDMVFVSIVEEKETKCEPSPSDSVSGSS